MNFGVYGGGVVVSRQHFVQGKGKGTVNPATGHESPEGE